VSTNTAQLFDTHSHIHFQGYELDADQVWQDAQNEGIAGMIAVGCRLEDSKGAIEFAQKHQNVWAAVGIHPHEAKKFLKFEENLDAFESLLSKPKEDNIVAIGEIGLDYYYEHSDKKSQKELLEWQLGLIELHNLPAIFHIRDAFKDFWPIYDKFNVTSGVVHSFTGSRQDLAHIVDRGLYVALNGIVTFSKDEEQLAAAKEVPLDKLLLETDAPYLTPKPFRGKICEPKHVKNTAVFLAELRDEPFEQLALTTTSNAQRLFSVK
jgi:TatD DNase family protein